MGRPPHPHPRLMSSRKPRPKATQDGAAAFAFAAGCSLCSQTKVPRVAPASPPPAHTPPCASCPAGASARGCPRYLRHRRSPRVCARTLRRLLGCTARLFPAQASVRALDQGARDQAHVTKAHVTKAPMTLSPISWQHVVEFQLGSSAMPHIRRGGERDGRCIVTWTQPWATRGSRAAACWAGPRTRRGVSVGARSQQPARSQPNPFAATFSFKRWDARLAAPRG